MQRPLDLLQSISGFAAQSSSAGDTTVRLGTVDPAYVASSFPGTLPKVTFDGESTLSGKRYSVMGPYWPTASDRVVLVPIGGTYLIVGALDADASALVGGTLSATLATPAYTNATLQNSWTVWGGGFATPGYTKMPGGVVKLQGLAGGGSKTSDVIFTLPSGYRPSNILLFPAIATDALGAIRVDTNGAVNRYLGTATWISLDSVVFPAGL